MKRYGVGIALAWILATAASVVAATTAVDAVRDRVTDRPSALVNTEGIGSSLEGPDVGDGSRPTVPATLPTVSTEGIEGEDELDPVPLTGAALDSTTTSEASSDSTTTSTAASNATTTGPTTAASSSSIPGTTAPPASSPQPTPTTTNPPPPPPTTTTTTTTEPSRSTSVYVVDGGTVRIRIDEALSEVKLMGTIPKTGFRATVLESGPTEVSVEFRSNSVTSTFRAYFEDGELVIEAD
ncbi:MAG: hypothetical protein HKN07_11290 [Acidimicrobiia bacterium]|nr:hypothetical protein [Acidimicrobiia bacterium]NNF64823.1 hypothetical protein [Acidimicrobiia bacterium]